MIVMVIWLIFVPVAIVAMLIRLYHGLVESVFVRLSVAEQQVGGAMIITKESLEALDWRRDRFHVLFASLYAGELDAYAASLVRGGSSVVAERLKLGAIRSDERGAVTDDAMYVAMHCAKAVPEISRAWDEQDHRDQARIRAAATNVAARVSMRMKMLQMRGEDVPRALTGVSRSHPIGHLDLMSLPVGRVCLIAFAPLLRSKLVENAWLELRVSGNFRTVSLLQRRHDPVEDRTVEMVFASVSSCDRFLVDLILAHRFIDLIVFEPDVTAAGDIPEGSFDVLQFRTPSRPDDIDSAPDAATDVLMRRLYPAAFETDDVESGSGASR
jgi:hypothetical protein